MVTVEKRKHREADQRFRFFHRYHSAWKTTRAARSFPTVTHRFYYWMALLHDSTAARVGALFQLLVQDTTAQDFGLPSSAIRLRM